MHDAAQFVGARLPSHAKRETGAHHRGFGRERGNPVRASRRGTAIPAKVDVELNIDPSDPRVK